ncbi:uncharacterized protein LOC127261932 isoform X1 [Andrographis paniculata]|uniref:uncharacterized protein LOC127261929 isoform X1 n=1 Tax=Andrographis paniculata TaxID=175694 RepID=UPI0021E7C22E|nr:uncharacterized protein LOC127261929 isoform X1 [Andrographis paniculata]XP_051146329.1 uncharacterized protein LOC127261929 isoform X1 [Andrographis paniculata]XP_051146332.1 uncharacterized protein LOC127261932 isoform X1 [Andrographis paniculata]XP_051146333.1 uncharacterized protein LOC127261932 isoform X1 [Andrographis paniculata]
MSDLYLSNQIPAPSDLESRASVFPYILNSYTFGFVLCFSGDYSGDRIEFQCCRKQAFARMMSDCKVEIINDGMQEFYMDFQGPNESNKSSLQILFLYFFHL